MPTYSERFVPETPPDWQRGALRVAAAAPVDTTVIPFGPAPEATDLWYLPEGSDLSDDQALNGTVEILRELKALGAAEDLIARCSACRAGRRGRGGRARKGGSFELLFLAFVDLQFVARQRFAAKVTADVLDVCGFDYRPTPDHVDERFAELEQDWREFRATKNVIVRAAVAVEPRIADAMWIDGTLLRSGFNLELMT
jgi:hypothetical protein